MSQMDQSYELPLIYLFISPIQPELVPPDSSHLSLRGDVFSPFYYLR